MPFKTSSVVVFLIIFIVFVFLTQFFCFSAESFENRFRFHKDISPPAMWKHGPKTYPSHAVITKPKSESLTSERERERDTEREREKCLSY